MIAQARTPPTLCPLQLPLACLPLPLALAHLVSSRPPRRLTCSLEPGLDLMSPHRGPARRLELGLDLVSSHRGPARRLELGLDLVSPRRGPARRLELGLGPRRP